MAEVLVLGAGLGGLSTAMLLARDGHQVTVLERDPAEPPPPAQAWEAWERRGVNQFHLPHFMLPRWRALIEREVPEVLNELMAAGGLRANTLAMLPESRRGPMRDGDERFEIVTARRPVLEAAVAAVAGRTPGVTIRRGVAATGLLTDPHTPARPPHVSGVLTRGGRALRADLVVDCCGRRSTLGPWLEAVGARRPVEEREDCGFVYYARHFRTRTGELPPARMTLLQHYDSVTLLTLPSDNGTWSVVVTTSSRDRALRVLRDPRRWDAALAWMVGKATFAASLADRDITRVYQSLASLLATPDELFADAGLLDRVMKLGAGAPSYPLPGPTRQELLAAVGN